MNRVAFITGGSRGIGYGIALELAKAGFDLAINGVRPATEVTEAINSLKSYGIDVIYCQGDVGSSEARADMINTIKKHYGQLQ